MLKVLQQTGAHVHLKVIKDKLAGHFALSISYQKLFIFAKHLDTSGRYVDRAIELVRTVILVVFH